MSQFFFGSAGLQEMAAHPVDEMSSDVAYGAGHASISSRCRKAAPTFAVLCALGGIAYLGHSTDWTIPSFSSLIGKGLDTKERWCETHNVPDEHCIECKKELLPALKDYGWCKEHGVAQCLLEHPELAQLKNPAVIGPEQIERTDRALLTRPRQENNRYCDLHLRRIQFASIEAMEKAGVGIDVAFERPIVEAIVANGELRYDETQTAHLTTRVVGSVWRVEKQVGDQVRKGDVLALIDAAEVGQAKGEFLQALSLLSLREANLTKIKPLAETGSLPGRQLREAEKEHQEAEIRLLSAGQNLTNLGLPIDPKYFAGLSTKEMASRIQYLGLPEGLISEVGAGETSSNLLPLRSPLDGTIVQRDVVPGEVVNSTRNLFTVTNVERLWLLLDVRQEDAKYVWLGQSVHFSSSGNAEESEVTGSVSWISTSADAKTRTVKVRVEIPNNDRKLRDNTFGMGRIVLREEPRAVTVPAEALHWDGSCNVVFVRDKNFLDPKSPKFFHVRKVRPGVKERDQVEIAAGVVAGEVVAAKNSVVLEAQLLKANLGEGCGCCAPAKKEAK